MRASPDALHQCTRRRPSSMHFMPVPWHYISGQFSIHAPQKPQKSAISLPQAPPKLLNFSLVALVGLTTAGVGISYLPRDCFMPMVNEGKLVIVKTSRRFRLFPM